MGQRDVPRTTPQGCQERVTAGIMQPQSSSTQVGHADAVDRTALRLAGSEGKRGTYYYVRGKLRGDPATRAIVELGELGEVLDLGCGRGHLDVHLLERGLAARVRGVDWDDRKIALARDAAEGLAAAFEVGDVGDVRAIEGLEPADTVLLVDVLHYLDAEKQDALVAAAADRVRPGGRLVVRDASTGYGWRSFVTASVERLATAIRFNIGERVAIRDLADALTPILFAKGLRVTVRPCWDGTPFANVLLVAAREAGPHAD